VKKKVDGKVVYEPDAEPVINEYDLVIPDEYSMINRDMVELILKENEAKVIFVGDQNQLPPVGESYSLIEELDIPNFRMEEPIRQAASNPIIELSRKMIQRVYTPVPSWDSKLVGGNGVKQIQLRRNRDMTNELFLDYFTSDNFRNDSDFVKVLSFTNKTVSSYNTYIRKMYFDEEYLPKIVYGERLVVLNAIKDPTVDQKTMGEGRILFHTNDEIEVLSYDVITQSICGIDITFYEATVLDYDDKEKEQVINIIHEKSEQAYKGLLKNLAQTAKDQNKPELRKQMWKLFFQVKESFAEVTYSYALTVHKSQGSTYNNVFFDMQDLGYYSTYDFKKRLQYTAVTRASEKLYLIY
jgi:exodeoxyribonuclease-5